MFLQAHTRGGGRFRGLAEGVSRPIPGGGGLRGLAGGGGLQAWGVQARGEGVSQHALRQTPQQTATAADGTHPTGMDSCCTICLQLLLHPNEAGTSPKWAKVKAAMDAVIECILAPPTEFLDPLLCRILSSITRNEF